MEYLNLRTYDSSEIKVSRIVMGSAMSMGGLPNDEIYKLYDYYIEQGGNCIDTARAYREGKCEQIVADYIQSRNLKDQIVLSTKGGHPTQDTEGRSGPSRLSREDITGDLETSLRVLGTDHVDLYWIHKDDPALSVEGIIDTVNVIITQGKVRRVGCSNWSVERIAMANKYAKESGQHGFSMSQIGWCLAATDSKFFTQFGSLMMSDSAYDWYYKNDMPVFAFSSQAQGFFARVASGGLKSLPPFLVEQYGSEDNMKRLEKVKKMAQERGVSISAIGLSYLVYNKLPCVAIIGAENLEMLKQSLESTTLHLSAEAADALY
jgi:aryl-alcohol dehydrogenase-like predicted oxidoreductase